MTPEQYERRKARLKQNGFRPCDEKPCPACRRVLPRDEFHRNPNTATGLASECKSCKQESGRNRKRTGQYNAAKRRITRYAVNALELNALADVACGLCDICGRPHSGKKSFHIDHNHESGKLRGILCCCCNLGLGAFEDNPARLLGAAEYLWLAPIEPPTVKPRRPTVNGGWRRSFDYRCRVCRQIKTHDEFTKDAKSRDGISTICQGCTTLRNKLWRHGLTHEELWSLFDSSLGLCAVCHRPHDRGESESKIDRDDASGIIRGVLCGQCSNGIGLFGYRSERLISAAEYLIITK